MVKLFDILALSVRILSSMWYHLYFRDSKICVLYISILIGNSLMMHDKNIFICIFVPFITVRINLLRYLDYFKMLIVLLAYINYKNSFHYDIFIQIYVFHPLPSTYLLISNQGFILNSEI